MGGQGGRISHLVGPNEADGRSVLVASFGELSTGRLRVEFPVKLLRDGTGLRMEATEHCEFFAIFVLIAGTGGVDVATSTEVGGISYSGRTADILRIRGEGVD